MSTRTNACWRLVARPQGLLKNSDFRWEEAPVPELADGQVLVRHLYLSLDPANRAWVNEGGSYMAPIALGDVMRGGGIGVVEESKNTKLPVGTKVQGLLGWQKYIVSDGSDLNLLPPLPIPLTAHFGLLGHIGFTSYFGLFDICKPKEGETLVVSAAAGAVGSIAVQLGKIAGCRVVGIAGSADKCKWIKDELGCDAVINYREENLHKALKAACPNGIDMYFENVGGETLEAVLSLVNNFARIAACGMISQYNATEPKGPRNIATIIMRRVLMQGFIVTDYAKRFNEAGAKLVEWYTQGKLKYRLDVVKGLENAPMTLNKLFEGTNQGKLLIEVSPE
jgi:NADPH-dependent curcumin reductase CurA